METLHLRQEELLKEAEDSMAAAFECAKERADAGAIHSCSRYLDIADFWRTRRDSILIAMKDEDKE